MTFPEERYRAPRFVRLAVASLAALSLTVSGLAQNYTINTFAGNGAIVFAGDAGPAPSAAINNPTAVALDAAGNVYIADCFNQRIRKVGTDGIITTIAGTGNKGDSGEKGEAAKATFNNPCGIALDSSGNMYVADSHNHNMRKIVNGTIDRLAGASFPGYIGDVDGDTTTALSQPLSVVVDASGVAFVVDFANNRIRKIPSVGKTILVAGTGAADFSGDGADAKKAALNAPNAIALDSAGNIYIADTANHRIRKVGTDGIITTIAGNGNPGFSGDGASALQASLWYPKGVAVDSAGNVYIADTFNQRIRKVSNGIISTIAGTGEIGFSGDGGRATLAKFKWPSGVTVGAAGSLYIVDAQNNRIRKMTPATATGSGPDINASGVITAVAFGGGTVAAPGSWIEIYGTNLATTTRTWSGSDFNGRQAPTSLGGTTVSIGGRAAFVAYVSPTQVNVQLPSNIGTGVQQLTVTTSAGTSSPYAIQLAATQPGLLALPSFLINNKQFVTALFANQTFVMDPGTIPGANTRPAKPGETIVMYGTGFGPVTPATLAGTLAQGQTALSLPIEITIGGSPASISYAGLVPNQVGLYQFNVVVPNVVPGAQVISVRLAGVRSPQIVYLAVGN